MAAGEATIKLDQLCPAIERKLQQWIEAQHVFFVATAPLDPDGHVNVSPKGLDTFRVLDEHTVAYLDLTGSGIETVAHVRENGRIVVMFTAFEGPPRIVRLHGRGEVIETGNPEWDSLRPLFPMRFNFERAIIRVDVHRVATSCGWSIPRMDFVADRDVLEKSWDKHDPREYQAEKNVLSIDSLAGLTSVEQLRP